MIAFFFALASSVVPYGSYDCVTEPPKWLIMRAEGPELRGLNFPDMADDAWKFKLELGPEYGARISTVKFDPLGITGTTATMTTGESSFALASYSHGGCVLTDAGCVTTIQFVKQDDGSLRFLALPSAIILIDDAKIPEPFNAIAPGRCEKIGEVK